MPGENPIQVKIPRLIPPLTFTCSTALIIAAPLLFSHYKLSMALLIFAVAVLWLGCIIAFRSPQSPRWLKESAAAFALAATFLIAGPVAGLLWLPAWPTFFVIGMAHITYLSFRHYGNYPRSRRRAMAERMTRDQRRVGTMIMIILGIAFILFNIQTLLYASYSDGRFHYRYANQMKPELDPAEPVPNQ